ncbi:MAG TPA: hypothetical protein ENI51_11975 [Candidatus Atribacteria bacterium]|nr:hypothetical protein [Candidatus Atribacteria bacterium]
MSRLRMRRKICKLILGLFLFSLVNVAFGKEENIIVVWCDKEIGEVDRKVFGNNFLGYDPATHNPRRQHYYGYADFGAGIWDPKWNVCVKEVINLAKEAGISITRFPGGDDANWYDWEKAIGENRNHFLYGIDEFLKTCDEIGAEAVFTVSCFVGNEKDKAELVEYTKGKIKYFEIGNEVSTKMRASEYAEVYLNYYKAMKEVDSKIKIGAVLDRESWNKKILSKIKDKIDFGIVHIYPTLCWGDCLSKFTPEIIFYVTLALPEFQYQKYIKETLEALKKYAKKDVPLAVTEFNCGFVQDWPVPYRHTLGCALVNAELLKLFMKPENNVLMANYWNFNNSYTGMIANGFNGEYKDLYKPYYKRPNFYVFEFYNKHFGDVLLETETECEAYNLKDFINYLEERYLKYAKVKIKGENLLKGKKWIIKKLEGVASRELESEKGEKILQIRFRNPKRLNYYHAFKICEVEPNTYYKLSGYIKAENFHVNEEENGFTLEVQDIRGYSKTRWAKATIDIKGTTDWVYVEKVFRTLPDSKEIRVIARRNGKKYPLEGTVYIKDVKVFKVELQDYFVPYLSVNASKDKKGKKIYLMVINKSLDKDIEAEIRLKGFNGKGGIANIFVLWGKRIDSTNEGFWKEVKVYREKLSFEGNVFRYKFRRHSLTAIEIEKKKFLVGSIKLRTKNFKQIKQK